MTAAIPPPARDSDAIGEMDKYLANELVRTRAHAEKWVTAITAITGVLTTATLIKGPDTFDAISERNVYSFLDPRLIVIILLAVGGLALVVGLYCGYSAASGSPIFRSEIETVALDPANHTHGAADKWGRAIDDTTKQARRSLTTAVAATLAGMVFLVVAIVYAAYAPAEQKPTEQCATIHLQSHPSDTVSGTIALGVCPTKP